MRAELGRGRGRLPEPWREEAEVVAIGHPAAGSAIIYSIVVSCQRHGKDPHAYLRDVLTRLPTMTNRDNLDALLLKTWQPA